MFSIDEKHLDILVNNAGVMCHPFAKTVDDLEVHFQTNYLGQLLTMAHCAALRMVLVEISMFFPQKIYNICILVMCFKLYVRSLPVDSPAAGEAAESARWRACHQPVGECLPTWGNSC